MPLDVAERKRGSAPAHPGAVRPIGEIQPSRRNPQKPILIRGGFGLVRELHSSGGGTATIPFSFCHGFTKRGKGVPRPRYTEAGARAGLGAQVGRGDCRRVSTVRTRTTPTCRTNAAERLGVSKDVVVKSGGRTPVAGTTSPMHREPLFWDKEHFLVSGVTASG